MANPGETRRTFDCDPTLSDDQVLEFCRTGFLLLEGVVPNEFNKMTLEYLSGVMPANPRFVPKGMTSTDLERIRASHEPSTILLEDWFHENVVLNPQLTGALRSLLGKDLGLPVLVSSHPVECPKSAQGWHHDADHVFGPETNFLEVFYFPQDTPAELGPTEFVPGSHIRPTTMAEDAAGVLAEGPAGSFGIHSQSILHRRGKSTAKGLRHMLKYNYWRTTPPVGDWVREVAFDSGSAHYGGHGDARYVAHMFYWLCGKGNQYRLMGGQAWPWTSPNQIGPSYGFGETEGYLPNWRKNNPDDYAR